jgi:hypothetical protein
MATMNAVERITDTRQAGLVGVDGRTYPLRSARLEAHAAGGVGCTTLAQKFGNPYEEPLEVTYTLPLPARGAVVGYTIRMGKRVIRGEVEKREQEAEAYRRAITEGRVAGLVEQDRADSEDRSTTPQDRPRAESRAPSGSSPIAPRSCSRPGGPPGPVSPGTIASGAPELPASRYTPRRGGGACRIRPWSSGRDRRRGRDRRGLPECK